VSRRRDSALRSLTSDPLKTVYWNGTARLSWDYRRRRTTDLIERLTRRQEAILLPLLGADWQDAATGAAKKEGLSGTLDALRTSCEHLQEEVRALATACGVSRNKVADVLTPSDDLQSLLRIASQAATLPPFCANWLVSEDAVSRRQQMFEEAESHWKLWDEQSAELFGVYEDGVLALDHAELLAALAATPIGLNRLVNMDALRIRRVLQGVKKAGAPNAERDMAADLRLAQQAKENKLWCDENEPALVEAFGECYRKGATDWDYVRGLLQVAKTLCDSSAPAGILTGNAMGGASLALVSQIAESGATEKNRLNDRVEAVGELLARMNVALEQLFVSAEALPSHGMTFTQIAEWCGAHSEAVREQSEAVRVAASFLLPTVVASAASRGEKAFPPVATLVADLRNARALQEAEADLRAEESAVMPSLCGPYLRAGSDTWGAVVEVIDRARELDSSLGQIGWSVPPDLLRRLAQDGDMTEHSALLLEQLALKQESETMTSALNALTARFTASYLRIEDRPLEEALFSDLADWIEARQIGAGRNSHVPQLLALRQQCAAEGLADFFDAVGNRRGNTLPDHAGVPVYQAAFYRAWVGSVVARVPVLKAFQGADHDRKIERFRALDRRLLEGAPGKIRQTTKAAKTKQSLRNEVNILTGQMDRRRIGDIRTLLAQIPSLLLALKPCVMMNPLSVRLFLDPDAVSFDIVLFDDASQIATEEALGAITRGRQIIIAGDSKQLPPLPLMTEVPGSRESILDTANKLVAHGSPVFGGIFLNWHYRSQHESLIAYSRRYFYPDLVAFPSASRRPALEEMSLPGTDEADARVIADTLLAYIQRQPSHSVGVIVLNEAAQIRLLDELARRKAEGGSDGDDELWRETEDEPFFIKTIEDVQGDERDMLLLSLPADPSSCDVLNRPDARFLLNVAVTRARRHMIIATSPASPSGTIPPAEPASPGAVILGQLLEVVREAIGGTDRDTVSPEGGDIMGASQRLVASVLEQQGRTFRQNVGIPECQIDFAIADTERPDQYSLGILCDGPTYAQGRTARQRDRQLPDILLERGWDLRRVWSLDCHREPEEQKRALENVGNDTPSAPRKRSARSRPAPAG
jgi:hypothetical protein